MDSFGCSSSGSSCSSILLWPGARAPFSRIRAYIAMLSRGQEDNQAASPAVFRLMWGFIIRLLVFRVPYFRKRPCWSTRSCGIFLQPGVPKLNLLDPQQVSAAGSSVRTRPSKQSAVGSCRDPKSPEILEIPGFGSFPLGLEFHLAQISPKPLTHPLSLQTVTCWLWRVKPLQKAFGLWSRESGQLVGRGTFLSALPAALQRPGS